MEHRSRALDYGSFSCMSNGDGVVSGGVKLSGDPLSLKTAIDIVNAKRPTRKTISTEVLFGTKTNFMLSMADNVSPRERRERKARKAVSSGNVHADRQAASQAAASADRYHHRLQTGIEATLSAGYKRATAEAVTSPTSSAATGASSAVCTSQLPEGGHFASTVAHQLEKSRPQQHRFLRGLKRCRELRSFARSCIQSSTNTDTIATIARTLYGVRSEMIRKHSVTNEQLATAFPLVGAFIEARNPSNSRRILSGVVVHETLFTVTVALCAPQTGFAGVMRTLHKDGLVINEQRFIE